VGPVTNALEDFEVRVLTLQASRGCPILRDSPDATSSVFQEGPASALPSIVSTAMTEWAWLKGLFHLAKR
jgi:hypothetical protein